MTATDRNPEILGERNVFVGGRVDGVTDPQFEALWAEAGSEIAAERQLWVAEMRALGATVVMPDDGWVDRAENWLSVPDYADFALPAYPGDLIALGGPHSWRLVKVTDVLPVAPFSGWPKYRFDPAAFAVGPVAPVVARKPRRDWSRALDVLCALVPVVFGCAAIYGESLSHPAPGPGFALGMIGLFWGAWLLGRRK